MIKASNISHFYGKEKTLNNINLKIKKGDFISLIGESGSGKSTLLSILSTLLKATKGDVFIDGENTKEIKNINNFRKGSIGFIFQFHYLINYLTVKENIQIANEKASKETIYKILEELDIKKLINKYPNELSGGQKQRVAIARALINNPKILFADEPTGNLDSKNSQKIFNLFTKLSKKGITIVVATHDLNLAKTTNKILEVRDGQIL